MCRAIHDGWRKKASGHRNFPPRCNVMECFMKKRKLRKRERFVNTKGIPRHLCNGPHCREVNSGQVLQKSSSDCKLINMRKAGRRLLESGEPVSCSKLRGSDQRLGDPGSKAHGCHGSSPGSVGLVPHFQLILPYRGVMVRIKRREGE